MPDETMTKHAAGPWRVLGRAMKRSNFGDYRAVILAGEAEHKAVAHTFGGDQDLREVAEVNAAHIVKCVNSHAALVEALAELYATVRGECPRLLDEDSGGTAGLDIKITEALAQAAR